MSCLFFWTMNFQKSAVETTCNWTSNIHADPPLSPIPTSTRLHIQKLVHIHNKTPPPYPIESTQCFLTSVSWSKTSVLKSLSSLQIWCCMQRWHHLRWHLSWVGNPSQKCGLWLRCERDREGGCALHTQRTSWIPSHIDNMNFITHLTGIVLFTTCFVPHLFHHFPERTTRLRNVPLLCARRGTKCRHFYVSRYFCPISFQDCWISMKKLIVNCCCKAQRSHVQHQNTMPKPQNYRFLKTFLNRGKQPSNEKTDELIQHWKFPSLGSFGKSDKLNKLKNSILIYSHYERLVTTKGQTLYRKFMNVQNALPPGESHSEAHPPRNYYYKIDIRNFQRLTITN